MLDNIADYRSFTMKINKNIQEIGEIEISEKTVKDKRKKEKKRKPLFPYLTTYYARHTWATIAAKLEIPKETIAAALGHGGNSVTDIYINFDQKKVDEANRKVLNYLNETKKKQKMLSSIIGSLLTKKKEAPNNEGNPT